MKLALMVLVACSSSPTPAMPDAPSDYFGNTCTDDGSAPLTTCMNTHAETGWCIVDSGSAGTCRRGCISGACPFGQTPTAVENDCYCKP